jgi:GDPmannose 4,6-dehydratase
MSRAIVIGSEGQDGRILFDRLSNEGDEVVGIGRGSPTDVTSRSAVARLLSEFEPDEIYYLPAVHQASQDAVATDDAELLERSLRVHVAGVVNILSELTARQSGASLFYAASSLVFGNPTNEIQDEATPLAPRDIYGITKSAGVHICRYYRAHHGARASVGFLYNHESPLRGPTFVSKRIARAAAAASRGDEVTLVVGDLSARTDWGYAPDYIDAMVRIVRLDKADDYVIATGEAHTVLEFVEAAFEIVGIDWQKHVIEDPTLLTRQPVTRIGNAARLRERTGWKPTVTFQEMVKILVDAELENAA